MEHCTPRNYVMERSTQITSNIQNLAAEIKNVVEPVLKGERNIVTDDVKTSFTNSYNTRLGNEEDAEEKDNTNIEIKNSEFNRNKPDDIINFKGQTIVIFASCILLLYEYLVPSRKMTNVNELFHHSQNKKILENWDYFKTTVLLNGKLIIEDSCLFKYAVQFVMGNDRLRNVDRELIKTLAERLFAPLKCVLPPDFNVQGLLQVTGRSNFESTAIIDIATVIILDCSEQYKTKITWKSTEYDFAVWLYNPRSYPQNGPPGQMSQGYQYLCRTQATADDIGQFAIRVSVTDSSGVFMAEAKIVRICIIDANDDSLLDEGIDDTAHQASRCVIFPRGTFDMFGEGKGRIKIKICLLNRYQQAEDNEMIVVTLYSC